MKYLNEWDSGSWIGFMIHWGLRGFFFPFKYKLLFVGVNE